MSIRILQGTVFATLPQIPPGSCDVVCTSPPYWQLRSYLPKGHPLKPLELGSEPTPAAYVENMVKVFRLVRTAMADHAVCWLNIGDTYAGGAGGRGDIGNIINGTQTRTQAVGEGRIKQPQHDTEAGSLCLIPQRLAIALSDDGWIVRSVVVWHKPAPMPASVAGWRWARCRVKVKSQVGSRGKQGELGHNVNGNYHDGTGAQWADCPGCPKCEPHGGYVLRKGSWRPTSAWEPILMLAKGAGYFCDGEAVKQPSAPTSLGRYNYPFRGNKDGLDRVQSGAPEGIDQPSGANLRDVWTIAAEPLSTVICEACRWVGTIRLKPEERKKKKKPKCPRCGAKVSSHYAAFPSELVLRCLRAGTSARGYCPACGAPWCRVVEKEATGKDRQRSGGGLGTEIRRGPQGLAPVNGTFQEGVQTKTLGWRPSCSHGDLEPRPGVVLDPFCGSGRTGLVARQLGLGFVGCELNPAYVEMAKRLLVADSPLFNQVEA